MKSVVTWGYVTDKKRYLQNHNTYGYQICHGGDVPQGILSHKFAWPLSEVVLWGHMKN